MSRKAKTELEVMTSAVDADGPLPNGMLATAELDPEVSIPDVLRSLDAWLDSVGALVDS